MIKSEDVDYLFNPLSIELQYRMGEFSKDFEQRPGYVSGGYNHELLNEREKYVTRVFRIQRNLVETTDQIRYIRIFLNRYPFRKMYLENGISQLEYIRYHTEGLYHKVHTVLEIMRLLVNEVYQLNIPVKDCSWLQLCKHINKKTEPMKQMDAYYKTFKNLIDLRHISSHRGVFNDDEMDEIELYYGNAFSKYEARGYVFENLNLNQNLLRYKLREYKNKRVALVDQVKKINGELLDKFLTSLHSEFTRQHCNK